MGQRLYFNFDTIWIQYMNSLILGFEDDNLISGKYCAKTAAVEELN